MEEIKKFRKALLSKVVRMEAMEEKFGIDINHLSLITEPESEYLDVNFELMSKNGGALSESFYINFAFYDEDDTICAKEALYIDADDFAGFSIEHLSVNLNTYAKDISKIVCYPSK